MNLLHYKHHWIHLLEMLGNIHLICLQKHYFKCHLLKEKRMLTNTVLFFAFRPFILTEKIIAFHNTVASIGLKKKEYA